MSYVPDPFASSPGTDCDFGVEACSTSTPLIGVTFAPQPVQEPSTFTTVTHHDSSMTSRFMASSSAVLSPHFPGDTISFVSTRTLSVSVVGSNALGTPSKTSSSPFFAVSSSTSATITAENITTSIDAMPTGDVQHLKTHSTSVSVLVGVGVGAALAFILIILALLWGCKRRKERRRDASNKEAGIMTTFQTSEDHRHTTPGTDITHETSAVESQSDTISTSPPSKPPWWRPGKVLQSQLKARFSITTEPYTKGPTQDIASSMYQITDTDGLSASTVSDHGSTKEDSQNLVSTTSSQQRVDTVDDSPMNTNGPGRSLRSSTGTSTTYYPPTAASMQPSIDNPQEVHNALRSSQIIPIHRTRTASTFRTTGTAPPPYSPGQSSDQVGGSRNSAERERSTAAVTYADLIKKMVQ